MSILQVLSITDTYALENLLESQGVSDPANAAAQLQADTLDGFDRFDETVLLTEDDVAFLRHGI